MAAISEARSVIHSDDARDLFKKSLSFLQVDNVVSTAAAQAATTLQDTARATGNLRLSALAARMRLTMGGKFDKVIGAIDKMIKELDDEMQDDKDNKKDCEDDREKKTKDAKRIREDENAEWTQADADDSAAIKLLE